MAEERGGSVQLMVTLRAVGIPVSEMVALSVIEGAGGRPGIQ